MSCEIGVKLLCFLFRTWEFFLCRLSEICLEIFFNLNPAKQSHTVDRTLEESNTYRHDEAVGFVGVCVQQVALKNKTIFS